jgi:hypothetical protein
MKITETVRMEPHPKGGADVYVFRPALGLPDSETGWHYHGYWNADGSGGEYLNDPYLYDQLKLTGPELFALAKAMHV